MAGREREVGRQGDWMHFISTVGWIEVLHCSNGLCFLSGRVGEAQNETVAPSANKQAEIAVEKIDQLSES